MLGWFAGALLAWAVHRSRRHPTAVIETSLLRVRTFAAATAATMAFNLGLSALFLGSMLFLTGVWGYSVLGAGLALSAGPLASAVVAVPAARLADRMGPRLVAAGGSLLFTLGTASWLLWLGPEPQYATRLMPGLLAGGIGLGMTIPILAGAAIATPRPGGWPPAPPWSPWPARSAGPSAWPSWSPSSALQMPAMRPPPSIPPGS